MLPERFTGEQALMPEALASLLGLWDVLNGYAVHGEARSWALHGVGLWPLWLAAARQVRSPPLRAARDIPGPLPVLVASSPRPAPQSP